MRAVGRVRTVEPKEISTVHTAAPVLEFGRWEESDPFLGLMEDWFERGAFGEHPHRGQETVTYVIDGTLEHYDNHSGGGVLHAGDVQWMTAGRGVIHVEQPAEGSRVHSLQLWVNLPQRSKMTEPGYQNLRHQDMPVREAQGVLIRVFSGSSGGVSASTRNHVPVTMIEMLVQPGATAVQDLPGTYNGFIYVLEGRGGFGSGDTAGVAGQVLWLGPADPARESSVTVRAESALRVLLYAGEPLREPVAAGGPFVMNTQEEVRQAFLDYRSGKFGR